MGILYDEAIRKIYIEELRALNVNTSQTGRKIEELDKDELNYELVMATFRRIDTEKDENKWF